MMVVLQLDQLVITEHIEHLTLIPQAYSVTCAAIQQNRIATALEFFDRRHQRAAAQDIERVHMSDKIRDILVGRLEYDLLRLAVLYDTAAIHNSNVGAKLERFVQIVADKDDGFFQIVLQLQQFILQVIPDQWVERGEGFVH